MEESTDTMDSLSTPERSEESGTYSRRRTQPRSMRRQRRVGRLLVPLFALAGLLALADLGAAHAGSIRGATARELAVPTWLLLATGGGVVGASFLLASFATDRSFVSAVHEWGTRLPPPGRLARLVGRGAGLLALAATLYFGFVGPDTPFRNLAVLVVWVAFWAGYVASTYLVGNTWPVVNPFRTLATLLPTLDLPYPERLGSWPAVAALLGLVWLEVVSPLADDARLLATVVAGYGLLTLAGSVAVGPEAWFDRVDPLSKAFAYYGRVAPVERTAEGLRLRLPGAALPGTRLVTGADEVAFVVALLFVTTFDGLVGTGPWAAFARALAGVGVPPLAVYLAAYLAGIALFYGAFRLAVASARRTAETFVSSSELARRFAPSLLAIAAGYHLAHNLGALLTLAPTLISVAADPFAPPQNPPQLAGLPAWFDGLELAFVLVGHLVAVWVAHAAAYELFPGRLQAVRSQYGVTLAMVLYTMTSLFVVATPYVPPPFLAG
jgi:hypothetical protein